MFLTVIYASVAFDARKSGMRILYLYMLAAFVLDVQGFQEVNITPDVAVLCVLPGCEWYLQSLVLAF